MNCHLAITRVMFIYLIDACVLRRKLNRRFHNKRRRRVLATTNSFIRPPFCLIRHLKINLLFQIGNTVAFFSSVYQ